MNKQRKLTECCYCEKELTNDELIEHMLGNIWGCAECINNGKGKMLVKPYGDEKIEMVNVEINTTHF